MPDQTRHPFDLETYVRRVRTGPCFICQIVERDPTNPHHVILETQTAIVFLAKYVVLHGYCLVAPKQHVTQVTADFSLEAYLELQTIVYRVAEALRATIPTERVYILSLGSNQGNAHVYWHVAPLPHGVPYEQQQFHALMTEHGVLHVEEQELADLATRLRAHLEEHS